jgi:hypothetical protein
MTGIPGRVCFEHGVEDDKEFSHDGGDRFFERCAGVAEALVERLERWGVANGAEGNHVEGSADVRAPSPDGSLSFEFSAVVVKRCQAGEGGDLFAVELAKFGEVGEQRHRGDVSDAWRGFQDVRFLLPVGVLVDEAKQFLFEGIDFLVQDREDGLNAAFGHLRGHLLQAIGFHRSQLDDLSATFDRLLQLGLRGGRFFEAAGADNLTELGKHGGVNRVGFGKHSQAFGEVADLARIGHCDAMAALEQFRDDQAFVTAGTFQSNQASVRRR